MNELTRLKHKLMDSPEFREEYKNSRADFEIMKALIGARCDQNLTQAELAERSGLKQSNISRIENGSCSPNVSTLRQIARGLGKELYIEFR